MTQMRYEWPLEEGRKFKSKYFKLKELEKKQQENDWLKHGGIDFGEGELFGRPYQDYHDYKYTAYECMTIEELKKAFLYGNWAIRQCFTYRRLAFINQINGGDEWWALKKFPNGALLAFESITMKGVINFEVKVWVLDINTSEFEEGEHFRIVSDRVAKEAAEERTVKFHKNNKNYLNKKARYVVGEAKGKFDFGIYFIDIDNNYFPEYIEQMLKASYEQCKRLEYTDETFERKWREIEA